MQLFFSILFLIMIINLIIYIINTIIKDNKHTKYKKAVETIDEDSINLSKEIEKAYKEHLRKEQERKRQEQININKQKKENLKLEFYRNPNKWQRMLYSNTPAVQMENGLWLGGGHYDIFVRKDSKEYELLSHEFDVDIHNSDNIIVGGYVENLRRH